MAWCANCKEETELYIGGDVPICTECFDAKAPIRNHSATENRFRHMLLQEYLETISRLHGQAVK